MLTLAGCSQDEGVTPLMIAAKSGNASEVKRLISIGARLDTQSRYGWTALMFAAWEGHAESVKILLDAGANPNIVSKPVPARFETTGDYPSSSALQEAIRNGHLSIATMLLDGGARIDPGSVALAGSTGDLKLLARLLKGGANLNASSGNGSYPTPLCTAAAAGKIEVVQWLIENGADPNQLVFATTALRKAVEKDEVEIVRYLLEHGADPNLDHFGSTSGYEWTALFEAATKSTDESKFGRNLAIIKMLLEKQAVIGNKTKSGRQAALKTIELQRMNTLKYQSKSNNKIERRMFQDQLNHMDTIIKLLKYN